jgi:predicted GNAT superfamily acetyltransferase
MTSEPHPMTGRISPAILDLNNAHAAELSWLDAERLGSLVRQSFYARKIGEAAEPSKATRLRKV